MFTYYLSSLHELREKNLELSRAKPAVKRAVKVSKAA